MKKPSELNDKVDSFQLLKELGYTAYSVGPIYAYAGVNEDIEERFLREAFESRPVDPTLTALAAANDLAGITSGRRPLRELEQFTRNHGYAQLRVVQTVDAEQYVR